MLPQQVKVKAFLLSRILDGGYSPKTLSGQNSGIPSYLSGHSVIELELPEDESTS